MTTDVELVQALDRRWAEAELAADVAGLDALATDDFVLVGPFGFILDRSQWLDRYRGGDLVTTALDWRDVQVRVHGDCAIAVGVHDQQAAHQGRPMNAAFRATHVLVRDDGDWKLAGMHLSPIGPPAGPGGSAGSPGGGTGR